MSIFKLREEYREYVTDCLADNETALSFRDWEDVTYHYERLNNTETLDLILLIGTQYIIKQGDRFLFDGVYEGAINEQIYLFNGGPCCTLRLTFEDMRKLTFAPTK